MRRLVVSLILLSACSGDRGDGVPAASVDSLSAPVGTPVTVAEVRRATLRLTVSGPGRSEALQETHVRAPFRGTLASLQVSDGDHVGAGAEVGTIVSRNSQAALQGARAMLESARTPADSADARRALELARADLVTQPLRAPHGGVIVSHSAGDGDLLNEGDEIVSIAALNSIIFVAQVAQSEVPKVRPGQTAVIEMPAEPTPLDGLVHTVLPDASSEGLSAPVRIDFSVGRRPQKTGLFGTALITVGEHADVPAVPEAAVLVDDVYGTSQVALVSGKNTVHWVQVTPGIRDGGLVEIVAPPLQAGQRVIVSGQVGLPEGAAVQVR